MERKIKALVVDSDIQARIRLKTATAAVGTFSSVIQHSELRAAHSALTAEEGIDVVFISTRFSREEVREFVRHAKASQNGQDSAYVLLLGQDKQDASLIAGSVLEGLDGFLFEPYSVEGLQEIVKLAAKVRAERAKAREGVAIGLLVREVMAQLDLVASLKKAGASAAISTKALHETCSVLRSLEGESMQVYLDTAVNMFEAAPRPKQVKSGKMYSGASKRAQAISEARLMAELKADIDTERSKAVGNN